MPRSAENDANSNAAGDRINEAGTRFIPFIDPGASRRGAYGRIPDRPHHRSPIGAAAIPCRQAVSRVRVAESGSHARIFQLRSNNGPIIDDIMGSRPGWTWRTPPPKTRKATNASQLGGQHVRSVGPKCRATSSYAPYMPASSSCRGAPSSSSMSIAAGSASEQPAISDAIHLLISSPSSASSGPEARGFRPQ